MQTKKLCTNGRRLLAVALAIGVIGAAHAVQSAPPALPGAQVDRFLARTLSTDNVECDQYGPDVARCRTVPRLFKPTIQRHLPQVTWPLPGYTAHFLQAL